MNSAKPQPLRADVVVYQATPGGVCAAAAAARAGADVLLIETDHRIGGLNTSGLNNNEQHHMFPAQTFGGLCGVFFDRLSRYYPENWQQRPGWFNSDHLEAELLQLIDHPSITLLTGRHMAALSKRGSSIDHITLDDGSTAHASAWIDASYEGDLMALAGVPWRMGREARSELEPMAGVTWNDPVITIDPYDGLGLLPGLSDQPTPHDGQPSDQVQVINFRTTLTDDPANRVPIPPPDHYNPRDHELLARSLQAGSMKTLREVLGLYVLPNRQFECNNNQKAVVSLAQRGIATRWPLASHEQRRAIWEDLRQYNLGVFHFLATDPRVPTDISQHMRALGFPAHLYVDNGHWPYEVYVREARRMQGLYTMTEHDIREDRRKDDAVCLGSHFIDSHWVDRYPVGREGFRNEGRLWLKGRIFQLPLRCMLPRPEDCDNLIVPVCVSATHVAWCAIRLEPTWMKLGEAAGLAAALSLDHNRPPQELQYSALRSELERAEQIIDLPDELLAL